MHSNENEMKMEWEQDKYVFFILHTFVVYMTFDQRVLRSRL